MELYVKALLTRVASLQEQYAMAVEQHRLSHLAHRDTQSMLLSYQQERDMLISMMEWWCEAPATTFDDKETLHAAMLSLRTAGRKAK